MVVIWCSISGHGFGHAAQVLPVLNELGRRIPDLKAILRTTVPSWFFEGRLTIPWEHRPGEQDIGCIQHGPMEIDVAAIWLAHRRFHQEWEGRVKAEAEAIRSHKAHLVLSDISYLGIETAHRVGLPAVGLCNLSWDQVLQTLTGSGREQTQVIRHIQRAYGHTELMIRPAPGVPMPAFRKVMEVGPIGQSPTGDPSRLRDLLGAEPGDTLVLVTFGGVTLPALPFEQMEQLTGYRFIVSGPVPERARCSRSTASIPLPFDTLFASADLIVSKPGYHTIVQSVASGKPVVYVRRYNFADEQVLVNYLHRYGRGVELPASDFAEGRWQKALAAVVALPRAPEAPPPPTGAAETTRILADMW